MTILTTRISHVFFCVSVLSCHVIMIRNDYSCLCSFTLKIILYFLNNLSTYQKISILRFSLLISSDSDLLLRKRLNDAYQFFFLTSSVNYVSG